MSYLTQSNFERLLAWLRQRYETYAPIKTDDKRIYERLAEDPSNAVAGEVRAVEPLKAFFLLAREQVAEGYSSVSGSSAAKPRCLVGVKACDLQSLKILDYVYKDQEPHDPAYTSARDASLIIASDCTCAIDTCFCVALDGVPYPRAGFDLCLSPLEGGFVVEVGSQKGQAVVDANKPLFHEASAEMTQERDAQRQRVIAEVSENLIKHNIPHAEALDGAVAANFDAPLWEDEAKTCVECGACNTVCPTCHCFFLFDQQDKSRMARFRLWDSCLIKDFARVAGGANPRPKLWMRLRNRFDKKFDFFPKVLGEYACTGCGRCVSACPAKIDIRRMLKRLAAHE